MRHMIFDEADHYPIAILTKVSAFQRSDMIRHYIEPLNQRHIPSQSVIGFTLQHDRRGKVSVKDAKAYLANLLPGLDSLGTRLLYVCDGAYFKVLTKERKAEPHYGYCLPCKIEGFEHMNVVLGMNHQQLIYNPDTQSRLTLTLKALADAHLGTYQALGQNVIGRASYPKDVESIRAALSQLHQYPTLSADIEAFSLKVHNAGVGTCAFSWNQSDGVAFPCDYTPLAEPAEGYHGEFRVNREIRAVLREFLEAYQGRLRWHNAAYDLRCLIWALWMEHPLDTEGLLHGLEVMTRLFDDTKIIAYLATNSTAGNALGLKELAHEFAGNYAQDDIKDIRRIPLDELLEYNLVDTLCTNYVHDTYRPIMEKDQQEAVYESLMLPSLKVIIQMELTGMPLSQAYVAKAREALESDIQGYLDTINQQSVIQSFTQRLRHRERAKANSKLKTKQHPIEHFDYVMFNPNSGPQLQMLLYEELDLPVIDTTATRQPATGADTLEKLINHTSDPSTVAILESLIGFAKAAKILSAFIPNFEAAIEHGDDVTWLHGNFNLGGTKSGRLSSSDPNLQQIPSGSYYGKLIKKCFRAPKGWLFCGADFNSLEDYISALTTKDPNKLKVYTEGYDGHCLRAFSYFPDRLPGIVDTVESINSIKKKYPDIRQLSKTPTFALTYAGTYITLMKNLGFDEETAKKIEANYHELYRVSDQWVQAQLDKAAQQGFVEVAFGLRLRTPLLAQTIRNHSTTPHEAEAEGRTAGNALGQSYGLLNNRAANAFMAAVWASPYRLDIKPVALIHDAIYLLIRNDLDVVAFANRELIKAMRWQELPEIQHDTVKLGAALDIFWPSWAEDVTLPNDASTEEIERVCEEHFQAIQSPS
ncbi:DNA polymerase [Larsenimonas suaedae]|uniref:DNA-directed DNA polymerase n=1 Tax=Larsenimonas suaedae TaxID=1851019 RepID=A0ABU1H0K0_9GAMM|nr:DNA polymerase [Larsenimonas suaedae]MCM2973763.1 DNA polymerase [Larsenimonas suaedae]MDR5897287.1 DNA polymerase [Larsenimonas suaedae]